MKVDKLQQRMLPSTVPQVLHAYTARMTTTERHLTAFIHHTHTGHAYRAAEAVEARKAKAAEKRAKEREEKAMANAREAEIVKQLEAQGLSDDDSDLEEEDDMELKR